MGMLNWQRHSGRCQIPLIFAILWNKFKCVAVNHGVLWAYCTPAHIHIIANDTATDRYRWGNKSIEFHRCRNCGCMTHWSAAAQPADRMGVNARLMAPEILAAARRRRLDGADTWKVLDE